jgi:hypothetical protein
VLRKDGTLWLNLGDSFWGGKGQSSQAWSTANLDRDTLQKQQHQIAGKGDTRPSDGRHDVLKPKDLCGIPWRVAFALQADGWWLRSDIIWNKPNPMPESVTDRPTKSHEYLFLLSKSASYFYDQDAVREPDNPDGRKQTIRKQTSRYNGNMLSSFQDQEHERWTGSRNRRSVWTIPTQPSGLPHFAQFPEKLVEPCVMAGSSEKGNCSTCGAPFKRIVDKTKTFESGSGKSGNPISGKHPEGCQGGGDTGDVRKGPTISTKTIGWKPTCDCGAEPEPAIILDPFGGTGTVALVAKRHGRSYISIDLSEEYTTIARQRLVQQEIF